MIEVPNLVGNVGGFEILDRILRDLWKVKPRVHWGLNFDQLTEDYIKECYPKYDKFVEVLHQMNSNGTFNNAFTDRVGLSKQPELIA